jgi:hypothetical protein
MVKSHTHIPEPHTSHTPHIPEPHTTHTSTPEVSEPSSRSRSEPTSHPESERSASSHGSTGGGGGGGFQLHTESLGTMEGHIGRTRDKVDVVGQRVASTNFGTQTMGVLGTGMTGTLNDTLGTAKEHVTRAGKAVEDAGTQTKTVRHGYETTETNASDALRGTSKDVAAPPVKGGGGGDGSGKPPGSPPPSSPPPPSGGGGGDLTNNQGNHATNDELRPQYPRDSMQTRPTSTDQQIRDTAARLGYNPDEHMAKTVTPTADLSAADRAEVVAVRNELKANPGEIMTKVVKPEMGQAILRNDTGYVDTDTGKNAPLNPEEVRGSVARGSDTAAYGTPQEYRDSLALDDQGEGWSPVKAKADEAWQLRFPASDRAGSMDISYGGTTADSADDMQRMSGSPTRREWNPPFVGTGYTGGGVPEWLAAPQNYRDRAEMYHVRADGTEHLAGVYLGGRGWFDVRGRGAGA